MRLATADFSKMDEAIKTLASIYEHRKASPRGQAELLWYQYYTQHMQKIREAWERGEFILSMFDACPAEIPYAMGIPCYGTVVYGPGAVAVGAKIEEATLDSARQVGLMLETCSGWRMTVGMLMRGWYPRPGAVVSGNPTCDTCAKCWPLMAYLADVPSFFIDVPFPAANERNISYVAAELAELVEWLENVSGKRMDWDKLREAVELGRQMVELNREIQEILKAKPSPIVPRMTTQSYWFNWIYSGTTEGVHFLTALRDEVKEKAARGESGLPSVNGSPPVKERFRIISIPPVPQIRGKTLDWLWREYGVSIVISTFMLWPEIEMDPDQPLESIARKYLNNPLIRQYFNPCESQYGTVTTTVQAAKDYEADGVIIWGNPSCDATSGFVKIMRDRLAEIGVPSVVFDHDPADPTYTSEEALKERMEEFVELLESREWED